jgi:hypothetical protein
MTLDRIVTTILNKLQTAIDVKVEDTIKITFANNVNFNINPYGVRQLTFNSKLKYDLTKELADKIATAAREEVARRDGLVREGERKELSAWLGEKDAKIRTTKSTKEKRTTPKTTKNS